MLSDCSPHFEWLNISRANTDFVCDLFCGDPRSLENQGKSLTLAERVGFEPMVRITAQRLSRPLFNSNRHGRQSQFLVVAGPRNQRYLHPRSLGAGVSICQAKEGGKLAIELHPELSIFRYEPDLFDELTNAFGGLEAGVFVIQGFGEIGDLLSV
jgi:hypothetical protein